MSQNDHYETIRTDGNVHWHHWQGLEQEEGHQDRPTHYFMHIGLYIQAIHHIPHIKMSGPFVSFKLISP